MLKSRLSVQSDRVVRAQNSFGQSSAPRVVPKTPVQGSTPVKASVGEVGGPMSVAQFGGPAFNTMFMGIVPDYNENLLLMYYRDCYYYDSVAGATVDLMSTMPFSDWTLTGIPNSELAKYSDSLSRLNMRTMLQEVSTSYLVDSAFIGSLVFDPVNKQFQDVMMHDFANASISPQPFYSVDPVIQVNSHQRLEQFLSAGSPYVQEVMRSYPKEMLDTFRAGSVVLDPLTTLYVPRKGLQDRTTVSYLKRLLPVYLLEKLLYRGTLTEAMKRQRATTHVTVGDDNWEPNPAEMEAILADFQRSELDPLGAWIVTRQGVNVNDVRQGGDFWKWTDNVDTLTPFKLRALGVSEAFLSGDASYATAEAAVSVFMENIDAYRQFLQYRIFTSRIFPLIAVLNGMYKDPKLAKPIKTSADLLANMSNKKNLLIPDMRWHKSLEAKTADTEFESLEKLSEKGFSIPLKMWAAAAGVDLSMLTRDLEEDKIIKKQIEQITGVPWKEQGTQGESNSMEFSFRNPGSFALRSLQRPEMKRVRPLLSREFPGLSNAHFSKSGNKVHAMTGEHRHDGRINDMIAKASRALRDPEHRERVRKNVVAKLGARANLNIFSGDQR